MGRGRSPRRGDRVTMTGDGCGASPRDRGRSPRVRSAQRRADDRAAPAGAVRRHAGGAGALPADAAGVSAARVELRADARVRDAGDDGDVDPGAAHAVPAPLVDLVGVRELDGRAAGRRGGDPDRGLRVALLLRPHPHLLLRDGVLPGVAAPADDRVLPQQRRRLRRGRGLDARPRQHAAARAVLGRGVRLLVHRRGGARGRRATVVRRAPPAGRDQGVAGGAQRRPRGPGHVTGRGDRATRQRHRRAQRAAAREGAGALARAGPRAADDLPSARGRRCGKATCSADARRSSDRSVPAAWASCTWPTTRSATVRWR